MNYPFTNLNSKKEKSKMKLNIRKKRAQQHTEVIISFIVFIGFLMAMLFFLNPLKTNQIDETILEMTEQILIQE